MLPPGDSTVIPIKMTRKRFKSRQIYVFMSGNTMLVDDTSHVIVQHPNIGSSLSGVICRVHTPHTVVDPNPFRSDTASVLVF